MDQEIKGGVGHQPSAGGGRADECAPIPVYESDALTISLVDDSTATVLAEGYEDWSFGVVTEGRPGDLSATFATPEALTTHPTIAKRLEGKLAQRASHVSLKSLAKALSIAGLESDRFRIYPGFLCADEPSGISLWLRWSESLDLALLIARNGWPLGMIPVGVRRGKRTHYLQVTTTKVLAIPELAELCAGKIRDTGSNSISLHELVAVIGDGVSYRSFESSHREHHRDGNGGDNRLANLLHIFCDNHNALHAVMDTDRKSFLAEASKVGDLALLPEDLARSIEEDHERLKGPRDEYAPEAVRLLDLSQSFDGDRMVVSCAFLESRPELNPKTGEPKKNAHGREVVGHVVAIRTVTSDGLSFKDDDEIPTELTPARPLVLPAPSGEFRWSNAGLDAFAAGEEPVPDLADRLASVVGQHVAFAKPVHAQIVVAYIAMTYLFTLARRAPFLALHSIAPDSGKTTLMEVLNRLAFNAVLSSKTKRASIVRLADASRCTLLLDEQENLARGSEDDLIEVLNSRHNSDAVYLLVDKEQKVQQFRLFGPTVIANLSGLTRTLRSRSIVIEMRPMPAGDPRSLNKVGVRYVRWQWLRDQLLLWAGRNWMDVRNAFFHDPSLAVGSNRHADLWRLLLAVAKYLGGEEMFDALREEAESTIMPQGLDDETEAIVVALTRAIEDQGEEATEVPLQHVCNLAVEHLEGAPPAPGRRGNHAMNKRIKAFCKALDLDVRLSSRFNKANAVQLPDPGGALRMLRERFPSVGS